MTDNNERLRALIAEMRDDFPGYAERCLKIRPKEGSDIPLVLNAVQRRIHSIAEDQRKRTGKVRLIILKARQPGVSTYVEARFYWRVQFLKGVRAFILTHADAATDNLFEMAKRYHANNSPLIRPEVSGNNAKELKFGVLDSSYKVGTAKAEGVGRSDTIQFMHGSEVAFWANADKHAAGVLQAVPQADDTEIWLESTANGVGGLFYNMAMKALRGEGDYELVFIPWFEHGEYEMSAPDGWTPPAAFIEYAGMYKLTPDQVYWSYVKNSELAAAEGDPSDRLCWRFRQEYPVTVEEAFRASREGSFIDSEDVERARHAHVEDQRGAPMIIGCDIACGGEGEGGDANCFIDRRGRLAGEIVYDRFIERDTVSVAGKLARVIEEEHPAMCFIDVGGGGGGVYDILVSRGYQEKVTLINFGSKAHNRKQYANKRAEMWGDMRAWLRDPGGAEIPDDEVLDGDLTAPTAKEDLNQRALLQKKEEIRKQLGFSPDGGDALALTFAEPVREYAWADDEYDDAGVGQNAIGGY